MDAMCGEMEFNLDGEEGDEIVKNVPTFRYLGQPLDQTDDDWPAAQQNIMRARSVWGRMGTLLQQEGEATKVWKVSTGRWCRRLYCMGRRRGSFWRQWRRV